jgi:hypothetical protein
MRYHLLVMGFGYRKQRILTSKWVQIVTAPLCTVMSMTGTIGCGPSSHCPSLPLLAMSTSQHGSRKCQSTLSQPLTVEHDWWEAKLCEGLLGNLFFSPWNEKHKEKQPTSLLLVFEHTYLSKSWLELWEPSCDHQMKAKCTMEANPEPWLDQVAVNPRTLTSCPLSVCYIKLVSLINT